MSLTEDQLARDLGRDMARELVAMAGRAVEHIPDDELEAYDYHCRKLKEAQRAA